MSDRYYLTSDDIRQQQRINRAVAELIDPAPVVNRRRNFASGQGGGQVRYHFQCEYVRQLNEEEEMTDYVRVFSEINTSVSTAGYVEYGDWLVRVPETLIEIPEEIVPPGEEETGPSGYVYLALVHDWTTRVYTARLIILPAPLRYTNETFLQIRQLAEIYCTVPPETDEEEEEQDPPEYLYNINQTLFTIDPVQFNSSDLYGSNYFPQMADLYQTRKDEDYTEQALVVKSNAATLKPEVVYPSGVFPIDTMEYPDPNLLRDLSFPVDQETGELPLKSIVYLADQNYVCAGGVIDAIVSYKQVNFSGRVFASAALVSGKGYTVPGPVTRCRFDWSGHPIYDSFQIDFTFTRQTVQVDETHVEIRDTATGVHIFDRYHPTSGYAGYIMNWQAPSASFTFAQLTGDKILYLTVTWDEDHPDDNPIIAYSWDISQIDQTVTWTKKLCTISGNGSAASPWVINQTSDRDFNIYGRWV